MRALNMKNTIHKLSQVLMLLGLCVFLASCAGVPDLIEKNKNSSDGAPGDGSNGDPNDTRQFPPGSTQAAAQEFRQPAASLVYNKIDILFVVDTSGSLDDERSAISAGILSFIAGLPAGADFRIAVMLAHMKTTGWAGRLYRSTSSEPYVLTSDMEDGTIQTLLSNKLSSVPDESGTDGGESGLYSITKALESPRLEAIKDQGFFRADAALAIAWVADENDVCSRYLPGISFVPDPNGEEIPAYNSYCLTGDAGSPVTHTSVYNRLRTLKGSLPILSFGMIYTGGNPIHEIGENEIGYGYREFTQLAQGAFIDLADPAPDSNPNAPNPARIASGLAEMADYTTSVLLDLDQDFVLEHSGAIASSIAVTVDGNSVSHTYNPDNRIVHLTNAGGAESLIRITYNYIVE